MKINNQKVWAVIVPLATLLAGYFGYAPVQELRAPPPASVDVEVSIPDNAHTHAKHEHKNWNPVIKAEVDKAIKAHITEHH